MLVVFVVLAQGGKGSLAYELAVSLGRPVECAVVERWQCHNPLHGDVVTGEHQRYHDRHVANVNRSYKRYRIHVYGNGNKRSRNELCVQRIKRNDPDHDGRSPDRCKRDCRKRPGSSIVECTIV